jgi:cobyrinic acid a,c-diamide synthase
VILVVNGAAMARSAAAVIHGFASFDPDLTVAGVIFNQVGSPGHEQLLREAAEATGVPVLGALHRSDTLAVPERHLGLVPAAERDTRNRELLQALAAAVAQQVDLEAVVALARAAPELTAAPWSPDPAAAPTRTPRIAVAAGPAFSFHYTENHELLAGAGAELVSFDPTRDERLPAGADALIFAGGFPEVYGSELASNTALQHEVADFSGPILGECGGLLYLGEQLDGFPMCGRLPLIAQMTRRLKLGYREATVATDTPWLPAGSAVRGHEFHYSEVRFTAAVTPAWELTSRGPDGITVGKVQAGYLHMHWAAQPEIAQRFVEAAWG